jgi:hypothetical protein
LPINNQMLLVIFLYEGKNKKVFYQPVDSFITR